MTELALSSVVAQLRAELEAAMLEGTGKRLQFELGPVEVSLKVAVGSAGSTGGKIRIYVLEAGADAKLTSESVQELKLTLTPMDTSRPAGPDGRAASVRIAGTELDGER